MAHSDPAVELVDDLPSIGYKLHTCSMTLTEAVKTGQS